MSKTSAQVVEEIRKAKEELEKSVREAEDLLVIWGGLALESANRAREATELLLKREAEEARVNKPDVHTQLIEEYERNVAANIKYMAEKGIKQVAAEVNETQVIIARMKAQEVEGEVIEENLKIGINSRLKKLIDKEDSLKKQFDELVARQLAQQEERREIEEARQKDEQQIARDNTQEARIMMEEEKLRAEEARMKAKEAESQVLQRKWKAEEAAKEEREAIERMLIEQEEALRKHQEEEKKEVEEKKVAELLSISKEALDFIDSPDDGATHTDEVQASGNSL
jgi:hypothetical protein